MSDTKVMKDLEQAFEAIRSKIPFTPKVGVILGSGLGLLADRLNIEAKIPYSEIPGFPVSTVSGHAGQFLFAHTEGGTPVVLMQGRVHYYEGYNMQQVVMPLRLMKMMGIETVYLSNAAGGANRSFVPGDLMIITDHIASFVPSPLNGPNSEELGVRFPDMTAVYDQHLRKVAKELAEEMNVNLKEGVYIQLPGPQYETPAEIRMVMALGADAVGMSTACEAIAARHMGLRVFGISLITNLASGLGNGTLSHEEVKECADRAGEVFSRLILGMLERDE
ncbi:MAG: purine-nucleoside phosphorylase [Lachnospiraceae bacterium]|nr:purine-nucleoside phosphorylase [Lachnospiraceae bacterium]